MRGGHQASLERHALGACFGKPVGQHTGNGNTEGRAIADRGLDMLGADQDIGEVDRPRHIADRGKSALAEDGLRPRIDREQLAGKPVPAQIDLRAGGEAGGVGGGADEGDAGGGEEGFHAAISPPSRGDRKPTAGAIGASA